MEKQNTTQEEQKTEEEKSLRYSEMSQEQLNQEIKEQEDYILSFRNKALLNPLNFDILYYIKLDELEVLK